MLQWPVMPRGERRSLLLRDGAGHTVGLLLIKVTGQILQEHLLLTVDVEDRTVMCMISHVEVKGAFVFSYLLEGEKSCLTFWLARSSKARKCCSEFVIQLSWR